MRYTQLVVVAVLAALVSVGCQHGRRESTREEIVRLLNYGESGLLVALTVAEVMGADMNLVESARLGVTEAFSAAHELVSIRISKWDKQELLAATDSLETATVSVITICRIAGVSQSILSMAEDSSRQAYETIRDVIGALPDRTVFFRPGTLLPSHDAGINYSGGALV